MELIIFHRKKSVCILNHGYTWVEVDLITRSNPITNILVRSSNQVSLGQMQPTWSWIGNRFKKCSQWLNYSKQNDNIILIDVIFSSLTFWNVIPTSRFSSLLISSWTTLFILGVVTLVAATTSSPHYFFYCRLPSPAHWSSAIVTTQIFGLLVHSSLVC